MAHEFEHTMDSWATSGVKSAPSSSLKTTGFEGGMKPPASVFNWFFDKFSKAITELQEVSGTIEDTVPITKGGTGATTATQALTNLGASASKDHKVKTYTSLSEIGASQGSETIADIVNKMPDNSILMYEIDDTYNSATYPEYTSGNAYLMATKINANHIEFMFYVGSSTSRIWTGFCGNVFGWSGWKELLTVDNVSDFTSISLASLGITATANELNKMDGVTATTTELNYVHGVTSNIQTQLDSKASSSHNHNASNITSGTFSSDRLPTVPITKGGTGATTAAAALSNLGLTATVAELNKMDGVTATTEELNYMDGVTSNVQTQLDSKASSSHNHSASDINSGTISSNILPTIPLSKGGTGATTADAALKNLGVNATASELNVLDGITASTTELNYTDGVTGNIQTQLNGKASSSHNHSASNVTAGTLSGKVLANATSKATLSDSQVRNIKVGTVDMDDGVTALATGDIYFYYE